MNLPDQLEQPKKHVAWKEEEVRRIDPRSAEKSAEGSRPCFSTWQEEEEMDRRSSPNITDRDPMPEPAPPKPVAVPTGLPVGTAATTATAVAPPSSLARAASFNKPQVEGDFNGDGIPDHLQPKATLRVVAPPNCYAGQVIHVKSPDGQMLPMTIPAGVYAGQALSVEYTPRQQQQAQQEQLRVAFNPAVMTPGQKVQVSAPDGQMLTATVPGGLAAGQHFIVAYTPKRLGVATTAVAAPLPTPVAAPQMRYSQAPGYPPAGGYGGGGYQHPHANYQGRNTNNTAGMVMAGGAGVAGGLLLGAMLFD